MNQKHSIINIISLILGVALTLGVFATLLYQEKFLKASFGYTPVEIEYNGVGGSQWVHVIDAKDSNLDALSIVSTRTNSLLNPSTTTNTHSISFGSGAIGGCTGWMFFETGIQLADNSSFNTYLKYCKTGTRTIEIYKTNDTTNSGESHGAATLIATNTATATASNTSTTSATATATPTPTITNTPTPTPFPYTSPYALCSIYREASTGKVKWEVVDFTYEDYDADGNKITKTDAIQSGSFSCTGDGGNTSQGGLLELPDAKTGYLSIPAGFSTVNALTCSVSVASSKGVASTCSFAEKMVSITTLKMNGENNMWHFPVSVAGSASVSLVYGGNSHAIYSLNKVDTPVAVQSNIVLLANKKADEVLEWIAPTTDTGVLKDFLTQAVCTPTAPCTSEKVIFYGGTKAGTSSVVLTNKTTKESTTYTIHTYPSAVKDIHIADPVGKKTINSSIALSSQVELYNGSLRNPDSDEITWEFSYDGGKTYTTSSSDGIISSGKFIPYKKGLVTVRAKTENMIAGPGVDSARFQAQTTYSRNTISFEIKDYPAWSIVLNGKSGEWHFPVGKSGSKKNRITYGDNQMVSSSASASPTATPSSGVNLSLYPLVSIANEIVLSAYNPENLSLQWYAPDVASGYLQNENGVKCLQSSPCTGSRMIYIGGTEEGVSTVTVINSADSESMSYTMHTLGGQTSSATVEMKVPNQRWYINESYDVLLKKTSTLGGVDDVSKNSNVEWEFSYDGGKNYTVLSADGKISGGIFTPYKAGTVLIRAKIKERLACPGIGELCTVHSGMKAELKEVYSSNVLSWEVKKQPAWSLAMNGNTGSWHIPITIAGNKQIPIVIGENISLAGNIASTTPSSSATPSIVVATATPSQSPSSSGSIFDGFLITPTVLPSASVVPTVSSVASASATPPPSGATLSSLYPLVGKWNVVTLVSYNPENVVLQWYAPDSSSGKLVNESNVLCTQISPCEGNRMVFVGGGQPGIVPITVKNVQDDDSLTYTMHVLPPATETMRIEGIDENDQWYLDESKKLKLIRTTVVSTEEDITTQSNVIWEFSSDGGKTFQTSSDYGNISGGIFTPKKIGAILIRARIQEQIACPGLGTLCTTHSGMKSEVREIFSKNLLSFMVKDLLNWSIVLGGKSNAWHIPVAKTAGRVIQKVYGENTALSASPTIVATISASPTPSASILPNIGEYSMKATAEWNEVMLIAHNPDAIILQWSAPESTSGYLKDMTGKKCTIDAPCTGNKMIFVGGVSEGQVPVTIVHQRKNESITYPIHVLPATTESISITPLSVAVYEKDSYTLSLNKKDIFGTEESLSSSLVAWEFSYDGGKTYASENENGMIVNGVFTPQKEGDIVIRAVLREWTTEAGETTIQKKWHEVISAPLFLSVKKAPIRITSAHVIPNNVITRNTTAQVAVTLASRVTINTMQSFSVGLLAGNVTENTYDETRNPVFILKEVHQDTPMKEFLAAEGGQNRGIFQLPLFIPEYDAKRVMKDGTYTIVVEIYKDSQSVSRYFVPVSLGTNFSNYDVNDDGYTNLIDVILMLKFLNGSLVPTEAERARGDKNQNGMLDVSDVLLILKQIV